MTKKQQNKINRKNKQTYARGAEVAPSISLGDGMGRDKSDTFCQYNNIKRTKLLLQKQMVQNKGD